MCPLRFILVFLSATLAGYYAWKTLRSDPKPDEDASSGDSKPAETEQESGFGKMFGSGFWIFMDVASGRYLWRNLRAGGDEGDKAKGS